MAWDCVIGEAIGTQVLRVDNTLRWWRRLQTVSIGDQIHFWGLNKSINVGCNVAVPWTPQNCPNRRLDPRT